MVLKWSVGISGIAIGSWQMQEKRRAPENERWSGTHHAAFLKLRDLHL